MMKFGKIIFISLLLVLVSLSVVSAAEDMNSTSDLIVQSTSDSDNLEIEDAEIFNSDEILKEGESNSIVITNDTFTNYFDGEGKILDSVSEGATLDFQGQITASDTIKAIYINKSVNIISSTKDATITLNSVNGTLGNENIANRFVVDGVSSITISNVVFNRTQMIIFNSSNVLLDNIGIISDNYTIISYHVARTTNTPLVKFENINGLTLRNSYIYVNNLGSRLIDCSDTKNTVFNNNIFHVRAESINTDKRTERIISFSRNDGTPNGETYVDTSLKITNNRFDLNYTLFSGSVVMANNILFENNTFEHPKITYSLTYAVGFSLKGSDNSNIIVRNNKIPAIGVMGKGSVYNNFVNYRFSGNGSLLIYDNDVGDKFDNYLSSSVTVGGSNGIFYNNSVFGSVKITGVNVTVKDSVMSEIITTRSAKNIDIKNNVVHGVKDGLPYRAISIQSTETFIDNNTLKGGILIEDPGNCEIKYNLINGLIDIRSKSSIIQYNTINAPSDDYAVKIRFGSDYIANEISNNKIYSKLYCGDGAVSYDERYLNFIEDNTPKTQIGMPINNSVSTFDYGGNTSIEVNMPGVVGNVTIDVDGDKYVVGLVNGKAACVLTKYSLGLNNVTVIYYDDVNDVWAINHTDFTVNKVKFCPVDLIYENASEGNFLNVNFVLPDDANGTVVITLTNGISTVSIKQDAKGGNNIITLPGMIEGNYAILATFTSIKYVTNSSGGNISFVHVPEYKLIANNVVMDYNDGSKYKVLLTGDGVPVSGVNVKITFNGKIISVKTDKNGYATLKLDAAPKTYMIKAEYNEVSKSGKVTIKNILKASNISKKKAKKVKFSATLKTSKGKSIVGKKITFKLKGKTYTVKTNKNGVATITLKNLKVGKYTITTKYGACTVKNTIKINK